MKTRSGRHGTGFAQPRTSIPRPTRSAPSAAHENKTASIASTNESKVPSLSRRVNQPRHGSQGFAWGRSRGVPVWVSAAAYRASHTRSIGNSNGLFHRLRAHPLPPFSSPVGALAWGLPARPASRSTPCGAHRHGAPGSPRATGTTPNSPERQQPASPTGRRQAAGRLVLFVPTGITGVTGSEPPQARIENSNGLLAPPPWDARGVECHRAARSHRAPAYWATRQAGSAA